MRGILVNNECCVCAFVPPFKDVLNYVPVLYSWRHGDLPAGAIRVLNSIYARVHEYEAGCVQMHIYYIYIYNIIIYI